MLGRRSALPFAFAPTGFTRMMHTEGERAVVSVAEEVGIPYTLSTMGTTTIEDVAAAAPGARKWFQLYLWRDRGAGQGPGAAGRRRRLRHADAHRGHPGRRRPAARCAQRADRPARAVAAHRSWTARCTRTGGSTCSPPSRCGSPAWTSTDGTVAELINRVFDPALTMADVEWLRGHLAGQADDQGHPERRGRPAGRGRRRRRGAAVQPRRPPARPRPGARWSWSSRWCRRSATGPRCSSTPGSRTAPTSSPRSRSARRAAPGRPGLPVRADGRRAAAAWPRRSQILTGEIVRTMQLIGVNSVDELGPQHVRLRPG